MADSEIFDVSIIGAGPTGLFAAYYAGFRNLRVQVIDSMPEVGGQITALYPEKFIYDVAGFPKVFGKELVRNLADQAGQYHPRICLNEQVLELRQEADGQIRLVTDLGEHRTRVVIITAGIGTFRPRKLPDPALARFEGKGLAYFVKEVADYRDRDLLIIGPCRQRRFTSRVWALSCAADRPTDIEPTAVPHSGQAPVTFPVRS